MRIIKNERDDLHILKTMLNSSPEKVNCKHQSLRRNEVCNNENGQYTLTKYTLHEDVHKIYICMYYLYFQLSANTYTDM